MTDRVTPGLISVVPAIAEAGESKKPGAIRVTSPKNYFLEVMKMRILTVLLICLMAFVQMQCTGKDASQNSNNGTKQSSDFKTWTITSVEGGGIDGRHREFSINSAGTIIFEDRKNKASAEMKTDNAETFAHIGVLLKQLDLPNTEKKSDEKKQECCDQVNHYFVAKLDERNYYPDNLNLSSSQTSDYQRLVSIHREIREKNETTLMNKAAELKIKNAKTLSVPVRDGNFKPVWEGKFSRKGESGVFEGEWKNNETAETVKDEVEVVLSGRTVKITRKGAGEVAVPKEFQGDLDSYSPGFIAKKISQNEINWSAHFE
jgi:hypothetical protein